MSKITAYPETQFSSIDLLEEAVVAITHTNLIHEQKSSPNYIAKYIGIPATVMGMFASPAFIDSGVANKATVSDSNMYQYNARDQVGDNLFGYSHPSISMGVQSILIKDDFVPENPMASSQDISESEAFIDILYFADNMDVIDDDETTYEVNAEIEDLNAKDDEDDLFLGFDDEDRFFFG